MSYALCDSLSVGIIGTSIFFFILIGFLKMERYRGFFIYPVESAKEPCFRMETSAQIFLPENNLDTIELEPV